MKQFMPLLMLPPLVLLLAGCDTFGHFQQPPPLTAPGTEAQIPETAASSPALLAAESPDRDPSRQGSLWRKGAKTFFRDPRARAAGDLVTVAVNLQEQAEFNNQTNLSRTTSNGFSLTGIGTLLGSILPGLVKTNPAVTSAGSDSTVGQGDIKRTETLVVNVAATVLRVLPNNNLEIAGSQQIRLNDELRELELRGIVRPEDIHSDNTITSDKIAEARIVYGGRGVSSDLQRPTWGQDVLTRFQPL